MTSIENPDVARVFDRYPEPMRKKLLHLRQIILDTASETEGSTGNHSRALRATEPSSLVKPTSYPPTS